MDTDAITRYSVHLYHLVFIIPLFLDLNQHISCIASIFKYYDSFNIRKNAFADPFVL